MYYIILGHLTAMGTITTWDAIKEYGCTRLSEYIRQIRKNYIVEDEWVSFTNRYGEKSEYKKYIFKGSKETQDLKEVKDDIQSNQENEVQKETK